MPKTKKHKPDSWMILFKCGRFDFVNLERNKNVYDIEVIAHHLGQLCRYHGGTRFFYSVAAHACTMHDFLMRHADDQAESRLQLVEWALQCLLHDAAEAYLGEVARPLKVLLPEYKRIEQITEDQIADFFGIPRGKPDWLADLDRRIIYDERLELFPKYYDKQRTRFWEIDKHKGLKPLKVRIPCWNPTRAKHEFLKRYRLLMAEREQHANEKGTGSASKTAD
jgi:hypothetical protein